MFHSRSIRALTSLAIGTLVVSGLAVPAWGTPQGCTPGYWKNHTFAWTDYRFQPDTLLGDVFDNVPGSLSNKTFLEALSFGGGRGIEGAAKILLRAATASVLNEANVPGFNASLGPNGIISNVSDALTEDRATIIARAEQYDAKNNAPGDCPLSGNEQRFLEQQS